MRRLKQNVRLVKPRGDLLWLSSNRSLFSSAPRRWAMDAKSSSGAGKAREKFVIAANQFVTTPSLI
jgi:hypothetical protein